METEEGRGGEEREGGLACCHLGASNGLIVVGKREDRAFFFTPHWFYCCGKITFIFGFIVMGKYIFFLFFIVVG